MIFNIPVYILTSYLRYSCSKSNSNSCPRKYQKITIDQKDRDAIFPDFSGITDFHKSKLSMKNL